MDLAYRVLGEVGARWPTGAAWCLIALATLLKRTRGLPGVYSLVRNCPVPMAVTSGAPIARTCAAVSAARVMFPFVTHCLVRSATTVVLLRCSGTAAHLVIGCRQLPFAAHAWTEVDGTPLAEEVPPGRFYVEIDRV